MGALSSGAANKSVLKLARTRRRGTPDAGIPVGDTERDRALIARLKAEMRKAFPQAVAEIERLPRLPRREKAGSTI